MFYVITIGDASSIGSDQWKDDRVIVSHFENAAQFMACRILLPRVDAVVLGNTAEIAVVNSLKSTFPQAAIVVANLAAEGPLVLEYIIAGVTDILFNNSSAIDSQTRLMTRIKRQVHPKVTS